MQQQEAAGLVAALVHAGDAVVPAQAVVVEKGPEEAYAKRAGREQAGEEAAAHGGAGGVLVGEGAEADAGETHAGGGFGKGEEEDLVEKVEEREGGEDRNGCELRGHVAGGVGGGESFEKLARGESEGGDEGEQAGCDDADVDDGGHEAEAERRRHQGEDRVERGFGGLDRSCGGKCSEHDGRPLGCGRFDGGRGGDLGGFDLEDAELSGVVCVGGLFAQGAFRESGAGLAGGDELARELDQVGGDVDGWSRRFEDGRLAEGDLFVEGEVFGFVERFGLVKMVGGGEGFGDQGVGGVFVETDGEGAGDGLGGRLGDGECRSSGRGFGRGDRSRDEDRGRSGGFVGELVEFEEELVLGLGNGPGVEDCDFCGGFGLTDGSLCFFGEEGAVALGLGVAFGDGGGDLGGAGFGGRRWSYGCGSVAGGAGATGAVSCEALGHLLLEGEGGGCFHLAGSFVWWEYVQLCGTHVAQT